MKKKVAILGLLLAAAATGAAYRFWQTTPGYALGQLEKAVKSRDWERFCAFVDLDEVFSRGLLALSRGGRPNNPGGENTSPAASSAETSELIQIFIPYLAAAGREELRRRVESGEWGAPAEDVNSQDPASSAGSLAGTAELQYRGVKTVEKNGLGARAVLLFHHGRYDTEVEMELLLEPGRQGHLQVKEILNLTALLTVLAKEETAWLEKQNQPVRDKLAELLEVKNLEKRSSPETWVLDRKYNLWLTVKNIGSQTITALEGIITIQLPTPDNRQRSVPVFFIDLDLGAGTEKTLVFPVPVGRVNELDQAVYATPAEVLKLDFSPVAVVFADQSRLRLPYPPEAEEGK